MTCKRETTASYWRFISVRLSVFLRMRLTYHSSLVSSALQSEIIAASPSKFARSRTSMHMNVQLVEHITFRLSVSGFAMPSACAAPKLSGVDSVVIVVDERICRMFVAPLFISLCMPFSPVGSVRRASPTFRCPAPVQGLPNRNAVGARWPSLSGVLGKPVGFVAGGDASEAPEAEARPVFSGAIRWHSPF